MLCYLAEARGALTCSERLPSIDGDSLDASVMAMANPPLERVIYIILISLLVQSFHPWSVISANLAHQV